MVRLPLLVFAASGISSFAYGGSVKGTVLFEGEPPTQPALDRKIDPRCSANRTDEAIVVTRGKLRDVVVRIENGTIGGPAAPAAPAAPVVIDQRDCMYVPRVVAIVAGQPVRVRNSDHTFHTVHGFLVGRDLFNKPQSPKAPDLAIDASAAKPGDVLGLKCDVHPWMKAYVAVNDSPYFAVTGTDGAFEIANLPEGTYTLEAWHPTLGTKTLKIVIGRARRGDVTARFSYKASEM